MMRTLYLDFETQSKVSLREVGVYRYAADPSTRVMCAGWSLVDHRYKPSDEGCQVLWTPEADLDCFGISHVGGTPGYSDFIRHAAASDTRLVAHNAEFEREILRQKYGVDVPLSRISCTAGRAARMSLPRSLEGICTALGLDEEKDVDGHRVLMKLTKPRRPSRENRDEFWTPQTKPEDFKKVYNYCVQDVRAMVAVDRALPELTATERAVWELTVEMNARGVAADMGSVRDALKLALEAKQTLAVMFENEFNVKIGHAPSCAKALGLRDAQKATLRDALKRTDLTPRQRLGIGWRQRHARSSVDKLKAIAKRVMPDGRLRGSLTYSGAERTQRWSGSGVQPQNFPRGLSKKTDTAFAALNGGVLDLAYDDVLKTLSEMLRGFLVGPFLVGDYAQVEARVLAWLAQEESLLELFRSGGDPYCALASDVFGREITKADEKERFMGKQAVLGCGYQIGPTKFRSMLDELHDVQVTEEFAKRVVFTYRRKYARVVSFWARMERAFVHVLKQKSRRVRASVEGAPPIYMGVREVLGKPFAYIELPSGRELWYAYPELYDETLDFGEVRAHAQYLGRSPYTHQWQWISTYGGKLTENIVQAISRDLLADAMVRLKEACFPLVLTVHDEVVSEICESGRENAELAIFNCEMNKVPGWASGLPLVAECFQSFRYRK